MSGMTGQRVGGTACLQAVISRGQTLVEPVREFRCLLGATGSLLRLSDNSVFLLGATGSLPASAVLRKSTGGQAARGTHKSRIHRKLPYRISGQPLQATSATQASTLG
jgi:hypothetical protein